MKPDSCARGSGFGAFGRAASVLVPLVLVASASAACGDARPPSNSQYAEYQCPAPIGVIVRDDCSHATLKFDGVTASGGLQAGPVGIQANYRDSVLREADTVVTVLKDQRESLCNNYNTCKLTREDYIREQRRIDTAFTALLGIKAGVVNMDAASAQMVMQQIRDIRSGKMDAAEAEASAQAGKPATVQPPAADHTPPRPPSTDPPAGTTTAPAPEWRPGKYMLQAVAGVADSAGKLAKNSAWGYDVNNTAIMGAYVKTGSRISVVRPFEAGKEYALLGQGSEGTTDLDMAVKSRADGKVIAADTDNDATPAVSFRVPQTGEYEVTVLLTASRNPGEFVAVAAMEKGGYNVPDASIIASLSRAVMTSTLAHRRHGPLAFHESGNWSLFATVLKQGESSNYGGILLESGSTIFLATADDSAKDVDLAVKDTTTSQQFKDTDEDATPVVSVASNGASHRHTVTLANAKSQGPSFVTLVMLDKMN
jgi:hypothetical protein